MRGRDPERPDDAKLYEELVIPLLNDFYRLACRLERDPDRAQDLLQDALLQGFRRFGQLRAESSFRAWMGRILVRTHLNSRRRSARELSLVEPYPELGGSGIAAPMDAQSPERLLSARSVAGELASALDRLPHDWALAVFLVDVQGYGYGEAALALEITPGTVASRVARGRAALRKHLRHLAKERGWLEE